MSRGQQAAEELNSEGENEQKTVCFNEAAANKPRKRARMTWATDRRLDGFNEAAANKPRKRTFFAASSMVERSCFNEAAANKPRKRR